MQGKDLIIGKSVPGGKGAKGMPVIAGNAGFSTEPQVPFLVFQDTIDHGASQAVIRGIMVKNGLLGKAPQHRSQESDHCQQ